MTPDECREIVRKAWQAAWIKAWAGGKNRYDRSRIAAKAASEAAKVLE